MTARYHTEPDTEAFTTSSVHGADEAGSGQVGSKHSLGLAPLDQALHALHRFGMQGADAARRQEALSSQEQRPGLVDQHPTRVDQPAERLAGIAVQGDFVECGVSVGDRVGEGRIDQVGPVREVAIDGDPSDAGVFRDLADAGVRYRVQSRLHLRRDHRRGVGRTGVDRGPSHQNTCREDSPVSAWLGWEQ